MQTISMTIVTTIVQRRRLVARVRANSGMNQAIEARKMAIEIRNFIGLIHGLMPVISRRVDQRRRGGNDEAGREGDGGAGEQAIAREERGDESHPAVLRVGDVGGAGAPGAEHQIGEQPDRPEKEGEDQAGHDQRVGDAVALRVADLPGADEEVERQVVDPAGQQQGLDSRTAARRRRASRTRPRRCRSAAR